MSLIDPVVLFFILGAVATLMRSGLRVPEDFYNVLSIYLLLSIGIKGGIELYKTNLSNFIFPAIGTILLGALITIVGFIILLKLGKFDKINAISIATHYGSVSAVTFAVVITYLNDLHVYYEEYMTVLLVFLEIPAIVVGVFMAAMLQKQKDTRILELAREVFFGKSILLLVGGLGIGFFTAYTGNKQLNFFFFDLFKGFLAIFMLEMGVVASARFKDLKKVGLFLLSFGLLMPILSALIGAVVGNLVGLSIGGTSILATMAASASYIAAPAAMKLALPQANATYSLTAALGITFPFNILIGIKLYYHITTLVFQYL